MQFHESHDDLKIDPQSAGQPDKASTAEAKAADDQAEVRPQETAGDSAPTAEFPAPKPVQTEQAEAVSGKPGLPADDSPKHPPKREKPQPKVGKHERF